ncbi:MAG TPA: hypothetical protein VH349_16485 [Ktedonobacterales bacterium]|jgi:hypothetical protein
MATYLARYLHGEHEQVWAELVALDAAVREESFYSDAWAVACETMRRVKYNIELLIPRLEAFGYQFGHSWLPEDEPHAHPPVFTPPAPDVYKVIAEFERRIGVLPLSLRAFYEIVGSVNFVGTPPEVWADGRKESGGLDALYVYPADAEMLNDAESWEEHYGWVTEEEWDLPGEDEEDLCDSRAYYALPHDCWLVCIAPDECFKYDISGCGGYDIAIPNPAADARLLTERHRTTFVNYLRICFRYAGFPKLETLGQSNNQITTLSALTADLLPI